jgi:hypothetical protein
LQKQKDSLSLVLETVDRFWDDSVQVVKKQMANTSVNDFLSFVSVKIDNRAIALSQENCKYYRHPHLGELGLRCFYPTDSLSTGLHQMQYSYKQLKKSKETTEKTLLLPFIKE